jgi:hypothetical protein
VVPDRRALRESCVDIGASTLLTLGSSSGDLTVWCNGNFPVPDPNDPPNLAVVSNLTTGAIIKITGKPDATHISYSQSGVANFSDAPEKGGFLPGDLVMKAQVRHYFVNTHNGLATGVPGLFRAAADTTGAPPGTAYPQQARPFVDTDKGEMIARYVEDLQITYGYDLSSDGLGKPPLTWQVGLGPTYSPGQGGAIAGPQSLRAIKVSIVIRSAHRQTNTVGTVLDNATWAKDYAPIDCDDHILATHTPDGYSRMYYSRTVDLPNMFPGGL